MADHPIVQFNDLCKDQAASLVKALPKGHNVERIFKTASIIISNDEDLIKCTPLSMFMSVASCALLGLEISKEIGEAYLVKYGDTCTLMPGYKGMIKLALKHPDVRGISVRVVRANDHVEIVDGTERKIVHDYDPFALNSVRGDTVGVYATYETVRGYSDFEIMNMDDLIACKNVAKTKKVWDAWPRQMQSKSVLKRLCKRMPRSLESNQAIGFDNASESGKFQNHSAFLPKELVDDLPPEPEPKTPTPEGSRLADDESDQFFIADEDKI